MNVDENTYKTITGETYPAYDSTGNYDSNTSSGNYASVSDSVDFAPGEASAGPATKSGPVSAAACGRKSTVSSGSSTDTCGSRKSAVAGGDHRPSQRASYL